MGNFGTCSMWSSIRHFGVLVLLIHLSITGSAQWKKTTFGIHYNFFIPDEVLSNPLRVDENESGFEIQTESLRSGAFGMGFKREFKGLLGFETGIQVANKNYEIRVLNEDSGLVNIDRVRWMNFHIPLLGRVRLKVNDRFDVIGLFGASFILLPSDLKTTTDDYFMRSFRSSWMKVALEGGVGMSAYLDNGNHFELVVGTHQPMSRLGVGFFTMDERRFNVGGLFNEFRSNLGFVRLSFFFHEDPERIKKRR